MVRVSPGWTARVQPGPAADLAVGDQRDDTAPASSTIVWIDSVSTTASSPPTIVYRAGQAADR